mmetsp:Transcript_17219/g.27626  ORF Transcript_17219/g.27626 Transcript_17219/m.27626 type:complete len:123 (+) Transcript_17219:19-387(+)
MHVLQTQVDWISHVTHTRMCTRTHTHRHIDTYISTHTYETQWSRIQSADEFWENIFCPYGMSHRSSTNSMRHRKYQKLQMVLEHTIWRFFDSANTQNRTLRTRKYFNPLFSKKSGCINQLVV